MENIKYLPGIPDFNRSEEIREKFSALIPGGAHTYAKGDDQYPQYHAPYIVRGKGCRIWDMDGNEFIEYAMGLRAVTLGHAFDSVDKAVMQQLSEGINFNRPSPVELYCAEELLSTLDNGHEMVKFAKNGSDATTAALKIARAYTGRDLVAVCSDHPFLSTDDWFIGSTPMYGGIPASIRTMTVKFSYNNLQSLEELFMQYPQQIAAVFMEPEKEIPPAHNYLQQVKEICNSNGALFILDEIISGFRFHLGGGQKLHNVQPDLSTFGKALANGYSLSALTGKKEFMLAGGINHDRERIFLLSTTFGAETHHLAAARATMRFYRENNVIEYLYQAGDLLRSGLEKILLELNLNNYFRLVGKSCCLIYATKDQDQKPSQPFRTLFLQETIKRGLLMPSLIVSYSHTPAEIEHTIEKLYDALIIYRKALDEGIENYLSGRPVKPVFRKFC